MVFIKAPIVGSSAKAGLTGLGIDIICPRRAAGLSAACFGLRGLGR